MAEGEEGWTWPTWGSGKGRSAEDRIEALQADLEDTMEGGDIEEQIVAEDVEAEEVDDTKVQAVGTVEEHATVVVEEEEEVDANEVLELRLQEIFADIDRKHAHIDKLFTKADRIRTTVLEPTIHTSTCEACIQPMVCNNYGVRGDHIIFLCSGCRLLVPSDLRCCNAANLFFLPTVGAKIVQQQRAWTNKGFVLCAVATPLNFQRLKTMIFRVGYLFCCHRMNPLQP
jgi:hypothetical protein